MRTGIFNRGVRICLLLAGLFACATQQPDLRRLYGTGEVNGDQPPVVIVPGTIGVRLAYRDTGNEIWPGRVRKFFTQDYDELMQPIDPGTLEPVDTGVVPTDIFDEIAGLAYYSKVLEALENGGGFVRTEAGEKAARGDRRYYIFLYDWRQDLVKSAAQLDDFLETIRNDWDEPDLKFDLIAHSMGGTIARYFIRYGPLDFADSEVFPVNNHGAEHIRRAVLVGTPNLGSVKAIETLTEGFRIRFVQPPPEISITYPSAYEMLPHPVNNWLIDMNGDRIEADLFDIEFWRQNELSVYDPAVIERIKERFDTDSEGEEYLALVRRFFAKYIERAGRFVLALSEPVPDPTVRYIVFGGVCLPTPARAVMEPIDGRNRLRFDPDDIENPVDGVDYDRLMLEPGDGIVTKASLLASTSLDPANALNATPSFALEYPVFLCDSHHRLTSNVTFQDNLLHALLSADTPR